MNSRFKERFYLYMQNDNYFSKLNGKCLYCKMENLREEIDMGVDGSKIEGYQ